MRSCDDDQDLRSPKAELEAVRARARGFAWQRAASSTVRFQRTDGKADRTPKRPALSLVEIVKRGL
jgi:hypothetical protein